MSNEKIDLPNPIVICKKCRAPQFMLEKSLIHKCSNDAEIFRKLTKRKHRDKVEDGKIVHQLVPKWMKEGRCKVEGCDGKWFDGQKITAAIPKYVGDQVEERRAARKSSIIMPGDPGFNAAVEEVKSAGFRLIDV